MGGGGGGGIMLAFCLLLFPQSPQDGVRLPLLILLELLALLPPGEIRREQSSQMAAQHQSSVVTTLVFRLRHDIWENRIFPYDFESKQSQKFHGVWRVAVYSLGKSRFRFD